MRQEYNETMETMHDRMSTRGLAMLAASAMMMLIATFGFTGCGDAITDPGDGSGLGFGSNATIRVSDPVSAQEAAEVRANVRANQNDTVAVEPEEIETIVIRLYPDGEILGIHLDWDRDDLNYEAVVRSGGKVYVVVIDPKTGTVKEKEEVKKYYYSSKIKIKSKVKVKVKEACDRGREIVEDGDVVEANLENIEGEPTYIIIILTQQNTYVTIYIDAETGKEKKLKNEKRCDGKDDDDDDGDDDGEGDDDDEEDISSGKCEDGDRHKNKKGKGHYRHGKGKGWGHHFHCHCDCECEDDDDGEDDDEEQQILDSIEVVSRDTVRLELAAMFNTDTMNVEVDAIDVKVENGDTLAWYDAVVEVDSNRYEVRYDARNRTVIKVTQTDGDFENGEYTPPTIDGTSLVLLSVARVAALAKVPGTITGWTLAYDEAEAAWVYSFEIEAVTTGEEKTVRVNAETGLYIDTK